MDPSHLSRDRLVRMFERGPSFAFVALPGDRTAELPALLEQGGYAILSRRPGRGSFGEVWTAIKGARGPRNSIVDKAWAVAAGHTILFDPEMLLASSTELLAQHAADGVVLAAIWERVSETVYLAEIHASGLRRQTHYCQGEPNPNDRQLDPHAAIVADPSDAGLVAALADSLDVSAIFGDLDVTIVELQE